MMIFLKAIIFILTGGTAFKQLFSGHKLVGFMLGIVAAISFVYLIEDISDSLEQSNLGTKPSIVSEIFEDISDFFKQLISSTESPEKVEIPPINITKGDFTAYFQPKKDVFEKTSAFQIRRGKLLEQFNDEVNQRNSDYQAGVLQLANYNADTEIFTVNLYWQADWVKQFFGELPDKGAIKIGVEEAKQIYNDGKEKPLFIFANLYGNKFEIQGVMVEKHRSYLFSLYHGIAFFDRLRDGSFGPEMVRIAEEKRKAEEQARKLAEEKRKAEEQARKLAEEKRKAEERRKAEEQARKLAEGRRKAEEPARKLAEERRKAEEQVRKLAEERRKAANKAQKLKEREVKIRRTIAYISHNVNEKWRINNYGNYSGFSCIIEVRLNQGGAVKSANIITSSGSNVFDVSVIKALSDASPLPVSYDLYNEFRHFNFKFSK